MKKTVSTILVFGISIFANLLWAQEITKEQMQAFQTDQVEAFKKNFSKDDFNTCFAVKENSFSLLNLSVKYDRKNIFSYLLNNNADVNKICGGQSPLMIAGRYGKADLAKTLLKKGAQKNLKNEKGETAKDIAVKYKQESLTSVLK